MLLSDIDNTHAALAELFAKVVRADPRARGLGDLCEANRDSRFFEKIASPKMRVSQSFYPPEKLHVICACRAQELASLVGIVDFDRPAEDRIYGR